MRSPSAEEAFDQDGNFGSVMLREVHDKKLCTVFDTAVRRIPQNR